MPATYSTPGIKYPDIHHATEIKTVTAKDHN